MKKFSTLAILLVFISCTSQIKTLPVPKEITLPPSNIKKAEPKPLPQKDDRLSLSCEENTKSIFNSFGVDVLPFMRTIFYDIDKDGIDEMIAGSKDGFLRLYRDSGIKSIPRWVLDEKYFDGIKAGAFSSPAVGDIDNDGMPEVLIGTGGFSPDSGNIIFYKNTGSLNNPVWKKMETSKINVGNDATPALYDIDNDGKLDLVVGNSTGRLFLFRNHSRKDRLLFEKDSNYFKGLNLGMYVVPTVTAVNNKIIIIAGNSMGKLYILEKNNGISSSFKKETLNMSLNNFASPAFLKTDKPGIKDMVISDGDGGIYYFKNKKNNYRVWEESSDLFSGRISPGAACTPAISEISNKLFMVTGNINGKIKMFEYDPSLNRLLPWIEKPNFFRNIKLSSFSRGILTEWYGKYLLITGQQDGLIKAFLNSGSLEKPSWTEEKQFFTGIPKIMHASPYLYDIDGDGKLELICGDADGYVQGYHYEIGQDGKPVWERIKNSFDYVKVTRYAAPAFLKDRDKLYLLVGQQDGKINIFSADSISSKPLIFHKEDYLKGIQVNNHSSPSVYVKNGLIEISIGDYNGNLKDFICKKDIIEDNLK